MTLLESADPRQDFRAFEQQMEAIREQAWALAHQKITAALKTLNQQVPGHTFWFGSGMGSREVNIEPPLEVRVGDDEDDVYTYEMVGWDEATEGLALAGATPDVRGVMTIMLQINELGEYIHNEFGRDIGDINVT